MTETISMLAVDMLHRRKDARPLNDAILPSLCDSIEEIGVVNPIRVRRDGDGYEVIAGAHRFAACDLIGLRQVPCIIVDDDDLHAELAMIDENLMRAELSASERASSTARRKAIYLELHPETAKEAFKGNQYVATDNLSVASFSAETAKATGKDERTIRRDAERGEKVVPEAMNKIAGTKLDTGAYLDRIKNLSPDEQVKAVERDVVAPRAPVDRKPVAESAPTVPANVFAAFIEHADVIETLPIPDLISASGRQRSVLGQRASGLADRMIEIVERLDQ
ncbi:ParB/RepB/Spo0J family partition protein [Nitratireductor aquimarinus]|uniref:ParB/RepB/Spo0J family partition protein n=1 Tax=Nitratireductor aquimarinus TaxID=889300 RepID=UPI00398E6D06